MKLWSGCLSLFMLFLIGCGHETGDYRDLEAKFSFDGRNINVSLCNPSNENITFKDTLFFDYSASFPSEFSVIFGFENGSAHIPQWDRVFEGGAGDFLPVPSDLILRPLECRTKIIDLVSQIVMRDKYSPEQGKISKYITIFKVSIMLPGGTNADGVEEKRILVSPWFHYKQPDTKSGN